MKTFISAGTETEKVNPPETTETKIPTPPIQDAEQQDEVEQIAQEVEGVNLTSNPNSSEQLTKVVEPPPVQGILFCILLVLIIKVIASRNN